MDPSFERAAVRLRAKPADRCKEPSLKIVDSFFDWIGEHIQYGVLDDCSLALIIGNGSEPLQFARP
jgi:hypothetical protein